MEDNSEDGDNDEEVHVPEISIPLSNESIQDLETAINPLEQCDDFGEQLYMNTVNYVYGLMINDDFL